MGAVGYGSFVSEAPSQPRSVDRSLVFLSKVCEESPAYRHASERAGQYESEGSEMRSLGTISVAVDARWLATLTVPIPDGLVAFLHLERRGPLPPGYRGSEEGCAFSAPVEEVSSVLALLTGLLIQARRDHVLPPAERE